MTGKYAETSSIIVGANDSGVKDSRGLGWLSLGCGFWSSALACDGGLQALIGDGWAVSTDRPTKSWLDRWLAGNAGVKDSRGLGWLSLGCGFWSSALACDGGLQALIGDGWAVSTDRPTKSWLDRWLAGNAGGG